MPVEQMIVACGGKENIRRVLRVADKPVVELINPALRSAATEEMPFNATLSQLSWQPEIPLSEQDWQAVGKLVESNQRESLARQGQGENSIHRPAWHHAARHGFINDPNGFIYHQGQYHLFYGLDPLTAGDKNRFWAHYTSDDLINWQEKPVALCPSDWFDCHGVYSGHAVSTDDALMLFYTGNVRVGEARDRITTQCLATSTDGVNFVKHGPVINTLPPGVTPHCRDPKLVRNGDHWLMLLGAQQQTTDGRLLGRLALYRSEDLYNWRYVGLSGQEMDEFGYMWECPDLTEVDGQLIAIFCPQGIASESKLHNIPHHSGYVKASLTTDDNLSLGTFSPLDHGFDFYASQTTRAEDGRCLLIGWMGMPDEVDQPSIQDNWLHQLTCIRELSWEDGKLHQRPVRELCQLRGEMHKVELSPLAMEHSLDIGNKQVELETCFSWPQKGTVVLRLMESGDYYCDFILDADNQRILLDRRHTLPTDGEKLREIPWPDGQDVHLQLLADTSSLELFINQGEWVMSARVFTPQDATRIRFISELPYPWQGLTYWPLFSPQMQ